MLRALRHLGTNGALASTRARCRWSGVRPRAPWRAVTHPLTRRQHPRGSAWPQGRSSPTGCTMPRQHTLHLPTLTWRRTRISRAHLLAVRNLITTTNDESYHGSPNELPPATWHGYAEWDFFGVPDPLMFQRFLDTTDYWFGCSDDSCVGSYDPAREPFVVVVDDHVDDANAAGASDGYAPQNPGPSAPPPRQRGAWVLTRS
jgi:hypothetical protein